MSKKEQKKEKRGIVEYLSMKAELPSDILAGEVRVELRGRNTMFLCGCRRISNYSPKLIVFEIKGGRVGIFGEGLICTSYHAGTVSVEGYISSVRFLEDGE